MVALSSLWLPILVSAVLVFIASSIIHMVLPYHRTDFRKVPDEDQVMDALRKFGIPPGDYMIPHCSGPADMKTPEFQAKWAKGPTLMATVWTPGPIAMGGQLTGWFIMIVVVSVFAGYMASRALGPGAEYLRVSQIASTTAFLAYAMAHWGDVIWKKRNWTTAAKATFDGLVYGLITGGAFGWLWPQ